MAGKFMKTVIPFMTLVIIPGQLAGCTATTSESPDVSIQQAEPEKQQETLDSSHVTDADGNQDMADGEQQELSGDALIEYFKLAYGTSDGISYLKTADEKMDFEVEVLSIRADNEGQKLPADYADQYRAWRPVEEEPAAESTAQQVSDAVQNQTQTQNQSQGSTQQQQQNQGTTQPAKPNNSDEYDPYDGQGSYEAYIDYICQQFPDLSREEIIRLFPDPATGEAGPSTANDMEKGLLSGN